MPTPDKRKAPLFHIGYPKAMSSWLQRHFFTPSCGFEAIMNQFECQLSIIKPAPFHFSPSGAQTALQSVSSGIHIPILSAEALSGNMYSGGYNSKELADRLFSISPDAKILILFREQKALLRSLYKSWIIWGMPHSIDEILSPETPDLIPQFRMEYLEFDRIIAYYQSVFGSANVLALPYEALLEKPYIHLRQIHKFSGADPALEKTIDTLPVLRRINKGQSLAWLYWLRWQNKYIYKTSFDRFGFIETTNDLLMRRISKSKKSNLPKFTKNWFEADFKERTTKYIGDYYKESNSRTAQYTGIALNDYGYDL